MRYHGPATIAIVSALFLVLSLLGCIGGSAAIGSSVLRPPELNISIGPVQLLATTIYPLAPRMCRGRACDTYPSPPIARVYMVVCVFTASDPDAGQHVVQLARLPLPDR
jgi:hypothetical protein